MNITVNGKVESLENGVILHQFLTDNKMKPDQVVVAINDNVVEREDYAATKLNEGDVLDVMSFVGGG